MITTKIFQSRLERDFETFVKLLPSLEPVEFMGLAKMLSVPVVKEDAAEAKTPEELQAMTKEEQKEFIASIQRPADEILEDVMDKYTQLNKKRRGEINQILKDIKKQNKKVK